MGDKQIRWMEGDANDFKPKNERRSLLSDQQQQSDLGKASFKTA